MARTTESEIAHVVEVILAQTPTGRASIAELIEEIPNRIKLSPQDLAPSPTRPGEALWQQQVRNIKCHRESRGNAIHEGRLISVRGGLGLPRKALAA
jgi:hypothetical protein